LGAWLRVGRQRGPQAQKQVTVCPCPFLMCPLAHKACVLDVVPGCLTSKDRLLHIP
ncbi:unnamed protein product, partial [Rangifer tarandus platyrhynchus]